MGMNTIRFCRACDFVTYGRLNWKAWGYFVCSRAQKLAGIVGGTPTKIWLEQRNRNWSLREVEKMPQIVAMINLVLSHWCSQAYRAAVYGMRNWLLRVLASVW